MRLLKGLLCYCSISLLWGCANQAIQSHSELTTTAIHFDKPREAKYFSDYVDELKVYAKQNGISDHIIKEAFRDVNYIERVVKADKNQPEKKLSIDAYLTKTVSPERVALAKQKYKAFYPKLDEATRLTHVPQNYILALWGVESAYGKYQGKEDIISAVSTLAFNGRRESFFLKELMSALTILQNGTIKQSQFKGSWAGAMGQNQFMPSSYLTYGLDGDNDGIIDIWNNMSDIFASTGNYLSTVGWDAKTSWGAKVKLPTSFNAELAGLDDEKAMSVSTWRNKGIKFIDSHIDENASTDAWIIIPEADSGYGYLVYNNFRTLMHWNRSYYFAISVGMLADSLAQEATAVKNDE